MLPQLLQRRASNRRRRGGAIDFWPTQVPAVTAWLRLAGATVTGSGYSSVPDMLNSNPAVQSTDARRPINGVSANGLPIATFADDFLSWPLIAANNGTVGVGFAAWVRPSNTGEIFCVLSGAGMASANKFRALQGATLRCDAYPEDRHAESTALSNAGAWQFVTVEVDCSKGTEAARVIHTVNGVVQTVGFTSGTPWPTSLPAPTGNMLIGAATASAGSPFRGDIGPNFFWLSGQLTTTERAALMAFDMPFDPSQLSAVAAWLRLANGTITGSGYSSVPDMRGATSPAIQNNNTYRPPAATSANGLPIATFTNHILDWPLNAANNGTVKQGFACWCKGNLSGNQNLFAIWNGGSGASAAKIDYFLSGGTVLQYLMIPGGTAQRANFMTANVWHFVTAEFDGAQATDQERCLLTVDGVVLASTNTTVPTALAVATGTMAIGAFLASIQPWVGAIGPNFYALNRQLTAPERAALMAFEPPFDPLQIPALSGWLRLANSLQSSGEWTPSIVDVINAGSPMVQTDTDRRAAVGASANGLPTMVFDGTDVHLWPVSPAHSSTTKVGLWLWYKPATVAGVQVLYVVANGIAGSGSTRLALYANGSAIICEAYITNANGRIFTTGSGALTAGAWHAIYLQYDSSRGGDPNVALYVAGVAASLTPSNIGAGGTLGALQAATGSALVGGATDSDTPSQPIANGGLIGPNILAFNNNLTAAQIALLLAFEAPT